MYWLGFPTRNVNPSMYPGTLSKSVCRKKLLEYRYGEKADGYSVL